MLNFSFLLLLGGEGNISFVGICNHFYFDVDESDLKPIITGEREERGWKCCCYSVLCELLTIR